MVGYWFSDTGHTNLSAELFAGAEFLVRRHEWVPLYAELLDIRGGRVARAWRGGRLEAGRREDLPLSSLGRMRLRPGAEGGVAEPEG